MAGIHLSTIIKNYDDTVVLKGIDLDIQDGEFLTLVGPSGCGKSTLLRIIAGLETQSSGDVLINNKNVNNIRASKRDLAMVFQSYALYPHLTVRQNMETPLRLRDFSFWQRVGGIGLFMPGRTKKLRHIQKTVNEVSKILKIDHLLDRKPGQLSGGQRQRVALGRAMVRKPEAFLMDEPLSNLDAALRVHMRAELAELHRSLGVTFVYVTHDQAEALTMSDRMAVVMEGRILQIGTPDDVYKNPNDLRVAEFVGSPKINILPGKKEVTGKISVCGQTLQCGARGQEENIYIGIRPEHLEICEVGSEDPHWSFRVVYKENLGSDFFLHGHIDGVEGRLLTRVNPKLAPEISIGAEIFVKAEYKHIMAFAGDYARMPLQEG